MTRGRARSHLSAVPAEGPAEASRAWDADAAVEALYAAHWRRLVRLSVLLVRDVGTAEEVVQDAFVAMHGHWNRLRDPDKAAAYLRQTVVNRSRSVLRHRGVVERHAARERPLEPDVPADADVLARDRREQVLDALRALPQRQREVLALRYYLDLSEADIADTLGISRGAVKSHASRGAAALRAHLDGADL
ncbi:SigE family RNA polymerase sigma factor [Nocardioides marinquilinus]|uniref:SigE family RNA polymerase sigma factor n=1 Tax=Nocardioides marinquilinus TaxID=1210400 RepID=A0ABP9Q3F1_9ACTN